MCVVSQFGLVGEATDAYGGTGAGSASSSA